ncbi:FUSC family protein [Pseudomonas sp. MYb185]|uniref:FUSC family protein n=1 Tax=Pseudomonas sp. MYb185 TaxID=1848729 RepID=UPI000CFD782B|nr:FUSC family protein [Pseudomonas sp. MYb185]PRB82248.1 hypothetical protein CQ007_08860 [Pseudomonas sp. MYb185]
MSALPSGPDPGGSGSIAPLIHLDESGDGVSQKELASLVGIALASCLAMALAWSIGLEHPQWSAMTAWAVSQPVRG